MLPLLPAQEELGGTQHVLSHRQRSLHMQSVVCVLDGRVGRGWARLLHSSVFASGIAGKGNLGSLQAANGFSSHDSQEAGGMKPQDVSGSHTALG